MNHKVDFLDVSAFDYFYHQFSTSLVTSSPVSTVCLPSLSFTTLQTEDKRRDKANALQMSAMLECGNQNHECQNFPESEFYLCITCVIKIHSALL